MPEHDACPAPAPDLEPAPDLDPDGAPARRTLVRGVLGLGVLGLAAAAPRHPYAAETAAFASPPAPSSPLAHSQPAQPIRSSQPIRSAQRTQHTQPAQPAQPVRSVRSAQPARPTRRTPAEPTRPAPRKPHVAVPDSAPAQVASRSAPQVVAGRAAAEQVAATATARAHAQGLAAAASVARSPRVVSTSTPGTTVPVAHDAAPSRVPMPAGFSPGYAAVARSTAPTKPGIFTTDPVLHLARRATFGPRPSDITDIRTLGIDAWLSRQLAPETIPDTAADQAWGLFPLAGASAADIQAGLPLYSWDAEWMTAQATLARQILSQRQLYEQVVDVLANHLHVAVPCEAWDTAPSYITQVIRPYAMGRYRDLLLAAMRHPAMMQYLNNDVSSKALVNENLGRELLELHTVGFGAGYTEAEVVASAKVLTGRMVSNGRFVYRPEYHWTGPLSVMGWSSTNATAAGGLAVGDDYLTYLANHPSTARTIARKLAVRFVSDQPPASLVDRMAAAYLAHDTDLRAVLDCLFHSPEFWASTGQKSRRPLEDVVGAARVLDMRPGPDTRAVIETLYWVVRSNGHAPLGWDPPNGYPDVAAAWNNAGNLVNRWTMHRALVNNWWQGMTVTAMLDLVPLRAGLTAGQWVDELSLRLLGQKMTTARRDAVVALANGIAPTAPAVEASWYAWTLIPLMLDSPYFQLR
ncbi:DUF1800 family protein [Dermatophilaceae bacterium Soc4.6]